MIDLLTSLRWQDFLDILIVWYIIYRLMMIIRGTRAAQMLAGMGFKEVINMAGLAHLIKVVSTVQEGIAYLS